MKRLKATLLMIFLLLPFVAVATSPLPSPTLSLRLEAEKHFKNGKRVDGVEKLLEAAELAREQKELYVQSNELRYVALAFADVGNKVMARNHFSEAMDVANRIPTWNHRLYASIGVVELQQRSGDAEGVHDNGLKAISSGLLEVIDETGQSAEMGRFFTALDGVLNEGEMVQIKERINALQTQDLKQKSLYALEQIAVKEVVP